MPAMGKAERERYLAEPHVGALSVARRAWLSQR